MHNPRWPHKLTAYREPLDANGLPVTDSEGNPEASLITFDVVQYSSGYNPVRNSCGGFVTKPMTRLPWGYGTSTGGIRDAGDVFKADYKISCPMFLTPLEEGVRLRLTDYTHTFYGVVKKCTTYNWGSDIWFDNPGNDGEVSDSE